MKNKIIVVGYPKSGNTWITRLVAEMIGCPVAGFYGQPNNEEIAIEGKKRISNFEVYKAHHLYYEIKKDFTQKKKIINIVRDVRDIAISGAYGFRNRFDILPHTPFGGLIRSVPFIYTFYEKMFGECIRKTKMINVLDKGSKDIRWCRAPWDYHINSYYQEQCFIIRYEDMLINTFSNAKKILQHLEIYREDEDVLKAIEKQSFKNVKMKFKKKQKWKQVSFLRSGKSGEWKNKLTKKQKEFLTMRFSNSLTILGYPSTTQGTIEKT